ncbi:uncharacterized protein LOC113563909 [Drosophila erecta]|nr:uncharacterized protein LOC113563909 [Drosophila erecta]
MKSQVFLLLVILCLVGMAPARRPKRDVEIWIRPDQYNRPCNYPGCDE